MSTRTKNTLWVIGILAVTLLLGYLICLFFEWQASESIARQAEQNLANAYRLSGKCDDFLVPCGRR